MARVPEVADLLTSLVFFFFFIDDGGNMLADFFFYLKKNVITVNYVCRKVTKYMYVSPRNIVRVLIFCCCDVY